MLTNRLLILPAEFEIREFWGRFLLGCFSASEDIPAIIGSKVSIDRNLDRIPPGLILMKSVQTEVLERMTKRCEQGFRHACFDEEGTAASIHPFFSKVRYSINTLKETDLVFFWGIYDSDNFIQEYPSYHGILCNSGNPRIDLWRKPFRGIYDSDVRNIKSKYGKFTFIPSNFGCSLKNWDEDRFLKLYENKTSSKLSENEVEEIRGRYRHRDDALTKYIEMIRALSKESKVIVRPHPSEILKNWEERLSGIENVELIYEGSVTPWLLAADKVIHHGSNCAIEASVLGVNPISYLPNYNELYDRFIANKVSKVHCNLEELLTHVVKNKNGKTNPSILDSFFYNYQGEFGSKKMLNTIKQYFDHLDENGELNKSFSIDCRKSSAITHFFQNKNWSSLKDQNPEKKWSIVSLKEVKAFVISLSRTSGLFKDLVVREIEENIFFIEKRG